MAQDQLGAIKRSELAIVSDNYKLHQFSVFLALSNEQRARGLMFVRSMPLDQGMLFIYPAPREVTMWMKNTHIPLDMLFINRDGTIHRIARNTTPFSESQIVSNGPVMGVLELNAGVAENLRIREGDRVLHPFFKK